jgi:outer membrane protein assembly factor BamD (BamD/ComL family)
MRRCFFWLACSLAPLLAHGDNPAAPSAPAPASPPPATAPISTPAPALPPYLRRADPRPAPEIAQTEPLCLKQADYLRRHNDSLLAIAYLRKVAANGDLPPRQRAQVILSLADTLEETHQDAEALCWLKIWLGLYPGRPEVGAVAYRVGAHYSRMGLHDLARDAFYMALSSSVNQGDVQNSEDLKNYTLLTDVTLWALADNEYEAGQWSRAARLLVRYRDESRMAPPALLEQADFLVADCHYQLGEIDTAQNLFQQFVLQHPFHPLAPEARLRLYHLDLLKKSPGQAKEELEALAWTVRTVWPRDEAYWQKRTADLLFRLNAKNPVLLPPLVAESTQIPGENESWQATLKHYSTLVSYEADEGISPSLPNPAAPTGSSPLPEQADLQTMAKALDHLFPPSGSFSPR